MQKRFHVIVTSSFCRHCDSTGKLQFRESALRAAPRDAHLEPDGKCPICDAPQGWTTLDEIGKHNRDKRGIKPTTSIIHVGNDFDMVYQAHTFGTHNSDTTDPLTQLILKEEMENYVQRKPETKFAKAYANE